MAERREKLVLSQYGIKCLKCHSILVLLNFLKFFVMHREERDIEVGCLCECLSIKSNINGHAVCIVSTRRVEPIIVLPPIIYTLRKEAIPTITTKSYYLMQRKWGRRDNLKF